MRIIHKKTQEEIAAVHEEKKVINLISSHDLEVDLEVQTFDSKLESEPNITETVKTTLKVLEAGLDSSVDLDVSKIIKNDDEIRDVIDIKGIDDPFAMTYSVKESKIIPEEQVLEKMKFKKRRQKLLPQRKEIDFSKYMSKELSKREAINSKDSSLTVFDVKVVDVNPIADSRISDLNPIVDPKIIDVNPIASSKIVGVNPIADAKVINVNPTIDPKIIDANPIASSKIIHVNPIVDRIIIHPSDFFRSLKRQKLQNFNTKVEKSTSKRNQ